MLRPDWGLIGLALGLLIFSMPGELFPAVIWQTSPDDLIIKTHGPHRWLDAREFADVSLHGRWAIHFFS